MGLKWGWNDATFISMNDISWHQPSEILKYMNKCNTGSLLDETSQLGPSEYEGRVLSTTQRRSERNDRRFLQTMWGFLSYVTTYGGDYQRFPGFREKLATVVIYTLTLRWVCLCGSELLRGMLMINQVSWEVKRNVACADRKTKKNSVSVRINVLNLNQIHRMPYSFVLKRTGIQIWTWR
jgi:hypothetical protein